jgi:hypothetical protein|tara:strand:- start:342 stop:1250 length:909 start_codon:yes stop_codon:yes gene_type:complete
VSEEDVKVETQEAEEAQSVEIELPEEPSTEEETKETSSVQETEPQPIVSEEEQELNNYSKNVQKRIKKLTEKYRQEERDREEAVRLAKHLREENEKLKAQMSTSQQAHLSEYGQRIENQLEITKEALRKAYDQGDSDRIVEAQQALSKVTIEQERYRLAKDRQEKVSVQQSEDSGQTIEQPEPQQQQAAEPDPKAKAWADKNDWFGQDEVMTYAAFGIHRKLVEEEGFDPSSDDYYNEIDNRMRNEFPQKFKTGKTSAVAPADSSSSRKPPGRRTVKLEPSEIQMARRLNVPLEEYAKYVKR